MSRIRSVHPGFFVDEEVVGVSIPARLLLIGLGTEADDHGVFVWKPVVLKMRIYPADNLCVGALLDELEKAELVQRFQSEGKEFGVIRNFRKHQKPKFPKAHHPMPADFLYFIGLKEPIGGIDDGEGGLFGEISDQRRGEESSREENDSSILDRKDQIDQVVEIWNLAAKRQGWAKCFKVTDKRKKHIPQRIKSYGLDGIAEAIKKAESADQLIGNDPPKWFDFDFLVRSDDSIAKIMEGKYDRKFGGDKRSGWNFDNDGKGGGNAGR